jgi:hypothetical protein
MSTAVIGIREMLAATIEGDQTLRDLTSAPHVYSGTAKPGASLAYVVLGQTTETPLGAGHYHRRGHRGTEAIRCWARTKPTAQKIYARLVDLLDNQRLVIAGHHAMRGTLEYVDDGEGEVDGKVIGWVVWARYRCRTLVSA